MWYTRYTTASLVGYYDADWARNLVDGKSTSGGCFFLGNNLVSWFNIKQNITTAKAKYIAVDSGCTELIWMKNMLKTMVSLEKS